MRDKEGMAWGDTSLKGSTKQNFEQYLRFVLHAYWPGEFLYLSWSSCRSYRTSPLFMNTPFQFLFRRHCQNRTISSQSLWFGWFSHYTFIKCHLKSFQTTPLLWNKDRGCCSLVNSILIFPIKFNWSVIYRYFKYAFCNKIIFFEQDFQIIPIK